jgi:hypothetical protein
MLHKLQLSWAKYVFNLNYIWAKFIHVNTFSDTFQEKQKQLVQKQYLINNREEKKRLKKESKSLNYLSILLFIYWSPLVRN